MSTANRVINRLLAALLGLVLLIVGIAAAIEILAALFGGQHFLLPTNDWLGTMRSTRWNAESVVLIATGVVVVGIVLMIAGIAARTRLVALQRPKDAVEVVASARAIAQILRREAASVSGVSSASSEVSSRHARVVATVPLADPKRVESELSVVLAATLRKIPWASAPVLEVEVSSDRPQTVPAPARGRTPHGRGA